MVTEAVVAQGDLDAIVAPRRGLVLERATGEGRFEAAEGPFRHYLRHVSVTPTGDGRFAVRQVVEAALAVPYWGWLFGPPYRARLRRLGAETGATAPWWAPPDRLDPEAAATLAALSLLSMILGYATILLSQTITFAAHEFGAGTAAQGVALAVVRFDLVLSF